MLECFLFLKHKISQLSWIDLVPYYKGCRVGFQTSTLHNYALHKWFIFVCYEWLIPMYFMMLGLLIKRGSIKDRIFITVMFHISGLSFSDVSFFYFQEFFFFWVCVLGGQRTKLALEFKSWSFSEFLEHIYLSKE